MLVRRGMSLVEVMVYCLLLALFSAIAFVSLPGRATRTTQELQDATSQASLALTRLVGELDNSLANTVTSDERSIYFLSATPEKGRLRYDSEGELLWQGWVAYVYDKPTLTRYWLPLASESVKSGVGKTPSLDQIRSGSSRVVARGVTYFSITRESTSFWVFQARVEVGAAFHRLRTGGGPRR